MLTQSLKHLHLQFLFPKQIQPIKSHISLIHFLSYLVLRMSSLVLSICITFLLSRGETCENDEILFYSVQQKWGIWMDIIYLYKLFKNRNGLFPAGYRKGKLHHSLLVDTGAMWQANSGPLWVQGPLLITSKAVTPSIFITVRKWILDINLSELESRSTPRSWE